MNFQKYFWLIMALLPVAGIANAQYFANSLGCVVISPNGPTDGGDYGPNTPSTQTSGLQEGLNDAQQNGYDVYIANGNYQLHTTLKIPASVNQRINGGNGSITYTPANSGPAIVVDSLDHVCLHLPCIKAPNIAENGALVVVQPVTAINNYTGVRASRIELRAITGGGSGAVGMGQGLVLSSTNAPITGNRLIIGEITYCQIGLLLDGNQPLSSNFIDCTQLAFNNCGCQIMSGTLNRLKLDTNAPGMTPSIGTDVEGGSYNFFDLAATPGGQDINSDLIITPESSNNRIQAFSLPNGYLSAGTNNQFFLTQPL